MRTCEEILDLISARLDGELTADKASELAEHLSSCPECKSLADDLADIHSAMPGLNVDPPTFIMERVMERIKVEAPTPIPFPVRKQTQRRWQTWGATAAALVLVAAGAFALWGGPKGGVGTPMTLDAGVPVPTMGTFGGVPEAQPSAVPSDPEAQMPMMIPATVEPSTGASVAENSGEETSPPALGDIQQGDAGKPEAIVGGVAPRNGTTESGQAAPLPSAAPSPTAAGKEAPTTAIVPTGVPLTPAEAAKKLYEEKYVERFPHLTLSELEDFIGYVIPDWSLKYVGETQDGTAYEFEEAYFEGETKAVQACYLVPLDGSEIRILEIQAVE